MAARRIALIFGRHSSRLTPFRPSPGTASPFASHFTPTVNLRHVYAVWRPQGQPERLSTSVPAPWRDTSSTTALAGPKPMIITIGEPILGTLPLASLVRGILTQTLMSQTFMMDVISKLSRSNMKLFLGNPLIRFLVDKLFYPQFCAGRTQREIRRTVDGLRELGYRGIILAYAREEEFSESQGPIFAPESLHQNSVALWLKGTLQTIKYAESGDFVAVKYTGAGQGCVRALEAAAPPDKLIADALDRICRSAEQRGVRLLFDAEHYAQQKGIHTWTLGLMAKHNRNGRLLVYNTYQMYLKESESVLASHIKQARAGGFGLGVKLVRGAYINSDPRHLIHDSKAATDAAFDNAAHMLATLYVDDSTAPKIGLVLASHNKPSMEKMRALRKNQARRGLPLADVVYAQLMGMADELSLSLARPTEETDGDAQVFKYVVWGSTDECMTYLLRRAEENRDAVERSLLSKKVLWEELYRRLMRRLLVPSDRID